MTRKIVMGEQKISNLTVISILLLILVTALNAQQPYRAGTTAASFLEIGYGGRGVAMGDAVVSLIDDASAAYWNPAGLGYMKQNETQAMVQSWFADISTSYLSFAYVQPNVGTFAASLIYTGYGQEQVTTVNSQEGTGEVFDGAEYSFGLSFGRTLTDWFAFGATAKYINSRIYNVSAKAAAIDLGAIVNTEFLQWDDKPGSGLNIGMSISNYGTKMTYDGIGLKQSVDILEDDDGNYANVPVRYELDAWEIPLIFRLGISFKPLLTQHHEVIASIDALHPNNNSESLNFGGAYKINFPSFGAFYLRGGYKGLFMDDSPYGLALGAGAEIHYLGNKAMKLDYAIRDIDTLGYISSYTFSFEF